MFDKMKENVSLQEAYNLIRENIALVDGSVFGMLEVSGENAADYLDSLVTRDIRYLGIDMVSECLFLKEDATVLGNAFICRLDNEFVVLTPPGSVEKVNSWIKENAVGGVEVKNMSDDNALLFIEGVNSYKIVRDVLKMDIDMLPLRSLGISDVKEEQITVARIGRSGEYAYALIASESTLTSLIEDIKTYATDEGWKCEFTTEEAMEVCMVETMQPSFKLLDSEKYNLFEMGIQWMIQYEKEDYIGYEKMKALFEEPKTSIPVGFISRDAKDVASGSMVSLEGEEIGEVLCACFSPRLNGVIGLAKVKEEVAVSGVTFDVETSSGRCEMDTISSPIIRPISWDIAIE